jgi:hypothetical protein
MLTVVSTSVRREVSRCRTENPHGGYRVVMSSPALPDHEPVAPPADPKAIRACLTPTLAAEFDSEWQIVLERVKQSQDLGDLHELLNKWRHTAYMELREPGSYYRLLSKAEQIMRGGGNPDAVSFEDMMALVRQRRAGA